MLLMDVFEICPVFMKKCLAMYSPNYVLQHTLLIMSCPVQPLFCLILYNLYNYVLSCTAFTTCMSCPVQPLLHICLCPVQPLLCLVLYSLYYVLSCTILIISCPVQFLSCLVLYNLYYVLSCKIPIMSCPVQS